ncbi:HNH endonuclease family protein [Roseospira navarrensis]|nr:HNH endonuclease family protein [Roseospira navarrensis]
MRGVRLLLVLAALGGGLWGLRQAEVFYPVAQPYDRALYDHWIDADGDCRDTRQEVLIRDSLSPVRLNDRGCRVIAGRWIDPYSGAVFTDPSRLDIDHLVPLAEAHRSGADTWTEGRRRAYANDLSSPLTLVATGASANRSKADGDPLSWLPWPPDRWCAYTAAFVAVKARWGLSQDRLEAWWTDAVLWTCDRVRPVGR